MNRRLMVAKQATSGNPRQLLRLTLCGIIDDLVRDSLPAAKDRRALVRHATDEALRQHHTWLTSVVFQCQFWLDYRGKIVAFLRKKVRCQETAEDLAQETFLRALHAIRRGHDLNTKLKAWLYAIARNVLTDRFRKLKRLKEVELPGADSMWVLLPNDEAKIAEYLDVLRALAGNDLTDLIRLRLAGLTNEEIARHKEVTERTVERWWQHLREIVVDAAIFPEFLDH